VHSCNYPLPAQLHSDKGVPRARWRFWAWQLYSAAAAHLPLPIRQRLIRSVASQLRGKLPPPATVVALILPDPSPDAAVDTAKLASVISWCRIPPV